MRAGQPLFTLHTDTPEAFEPALEALEGAASFGPADAEFTQAPLVLDRVAAPTL